jgi:hypothetical protein
MEKTMCKKLFFLLPLLLLAACNFPYTHLPTLPPTLAVDPSLTPSQVITITASLAPTLTVTPTLLPPASTVTVVSPTAVSPSATPISPTIASPSVTQSALQPSLTHTVALPLITMTGTLAPSMPYKVQPGTPSLTANFAHSEVGCQWLAVAGQVFDASGQEVSNLVVQVSGTLNGQAVDEISMTGVALDYGPGGYEVKLADQATASPGTLVIQLFDLQAHPLSEPVLFDTSADCHKNVVLINFVP